jgi:uncharacterized iron-regulated membrane protein
MLLKPLLLRFHRWISLTFALPLLVVIATGLILSFEPATETGRPSVPLDEARLQSLIKLADPSGTATSLAIRGRDDTLSVGGRGTTVEIDLATGQVREGGTSTLNALYRWARPMHEHLIGDLGWLVLASTIAMLVISALGVLMGLPRFRNTLGGWHNAGAWLLLPLVILSPATGLMLALGLGNGAGFGGPGGGAGGRVTLAETVSLVARQHDLADLAQIRGRGGRLLVRVVVGTTPVTYGASKAGLAPLPTNWSRSLHEGTWNTVWGPLANAVVSLLFLMLLGTGGTIWLRRTLKQRRIRAQKRAPALQPERA